MTLDSLTDGCRLDIEIDAGHDDGQRRRPAYDRRFRPVRPQHIADIEGGRDNAEADQRERRGQWIGAGATAVAVPMSETGHIEGRSESPAIMPRGEPSAARPALTFD
jgi:hypothetical protein